MAKNIHGWMGFLSDNEIVCCLWYLDTKFMILVNILFWKIENMWFFTFLGCNWWKMRAAQKLFLILCQVYIYLQKRPRPLKFEDISKYLPPPLKEQFTMLLFLKYSSNGGGRYFEVSSNFSGLCLFWR